MSDITQEILDLCEQSLVNVQRMVKERQQHIKRIEELEGALKMWIDYDSSDMCDVSCMINYAKALSATKKALHPNKDKGEL